MKIKCDLQEILDLTYEKLWNEGLLLSTIESERHYNIMTIGWGLIGRIWSKPTFTIAVRSTRFSHLLLEDNPEFTVNIPAKEMKKIVKYCGTISGRDYDKFKETGLTSLKGRLVDSPLIQECVAHYECKIIGKFTMTPESLSAEVTKRHYSSRDYHTLYFGEILATLKNS